MPSSERKSLFLRGMPVELLREAKAAAARRGETLTTIVAEALTRSLGVDSVPQRGPDALEREMAWYRKNLPALLRRYPGEYVAIVDAAVVDHDRDFSPLAGRVFARFGNRSIYMPRVQAAERVARVRSPRRARS
jgi:Family of unknown function (DUF5678)